MQNYTMSAITGTHKIDQTIKNRSDDTNEYPDLWVVIIERKDIVTSLMSEQNAREVRIFHFKYNSIN